MLIIMWQQTNKYLSVLEQWHSLVMSDIDGNTTKKYLLIKQNLKCSS